MGLWEIHPALVHFPIAFLIGGVVLDLYDWRRGDSGISWIATRLIGFGVATAALAAAAGLLAFFTAPASFTEEAGGMIWWHIGAAVAQLVLFGIVGHARWKSLPGAPPAWTRVVGLVAVALLLVAGYVGGYVVYHGATGIEPKLLAPELREKQTRKKQEDAKKPKSGGAALQNPRVGDRPV